MARQISDVFQINKSSYLEAFVKGVKNISNSNLFSSFGKLAFLQKFANKRSSCWKKTPFFGENILKIFFV